MEPMKLIFVLALLKELLLVIYVVVILLVPLAVEFELVVFVVYVRW